MRIVTFGWYNKNIYMGQLNLGYYTFCLLTMTTMTMTNVILHNSLYTKSCHGYLEQQSFDELRLSVFISI